MSNKALDSHTNKPYLKVDGVKVDVTEEQYHTWLMMVNHERNHARRVKECGQPNFFYCCGDCGLCRWRMHGTVLQIDALSNILVRNPVPLSSGSNSPDPEEVVASKQFCDSIYKYARSAVTEGDKILYYYAEESMPMVQIAAALGLPRETVRNRLKSLLKQLRKNYDAILAG